LESAPAEKEVPVEEAPVVEVGALVVEVGAPVVVEEEAPVAEGEDPAVEVEDPVVEVVVVEVVLCPAGVLGQWPSPRS